MSVGSAAGSTLSTSASDLSEVVLAGSWVGQIPSLTDYSTRMVLGGTALLGMTGGVIGVFLLLRKRSLISDVIGHCALPGIVMAFLLCEVWQPGQGRNVPMMMLGAAVAGLVGALSVLIVERFTRIRADAAMAIVLSSFYGLGTVLLSIAQRVPSQSAAGLKDYLSGRPASMSSDDVWLMLICSGVLLAVVAVLFKELTLLCFDADYAAAGGWPVWALDTLLMGLVMGMTILGMQTVGLLLVVAVLVIPAATARFWTHSIHRMVWIAGGCGGLAAVAGTLISASFPRVAAGAVIVLMGSLLFAISLLIGPQRGLLWGWLEQRRLQERVGEHDLLRAIYELIEAETWRVLGRRPTEAEWLNRLVRTSELLQLRTWQPARFRQLLDRAVRAGLLLVDPEGWRLSPEGLDRARRAARNHRLWELYLIMHADVGPGRVDRSADRIEHCLEPEVIRELESRLAVEEELGMLESPHKAV
jgi:manganese/zinc/iron transport system permease protein